LLKIFQVNSLPTNKQEKCSSGSLSTTIITFANLKKNEKFKDGFKSGKCFIPFSKDVREIRGNFEDGKFVVTHFLPAICKKFDLKKFICSFINVHLNIIIPWLVCFLVS
jgi:hypothetical protein